MRLFISAGEPSGDLHGGNLVRALRRADPGVELCGFGGERMSAAGCPLLYPLAEHAVIGLTQAAAAVPMVWHVLSLADRRFRDQRPDAVVVIDNPGFHWWLARTARKHGIPVIYFVAPQLWAWGAWRVGKMRRLIDCVLCTLPFEQPWYESRGVSARYIGHPYFDELSNQRLDAEFLSAQRARPGTIVGLLPGSRRQELENNPPSLLRSAEIIHAKRPDTRFLVACLKEEHCRRVQALLQGRNLPVEVYAGRTPEIIELAHSTISVSGSVGLELLYAAKPSVVTFRVARLGMLLAFLLKKVPYISLVNLLANRELFPEFLSSQCEAEGMAGHILNWLENPATYQALRQELTDLRDSVGEPGACERAARQIMDIAATPLRRAA